MDCPRVICALLLAASTAVLGCGGDDDDPGRTVSLDRGETLSVVAREYSFDPETVLIAGEGEPLQVELRNAGTLAHNLRMMRGDRELGGTPTFQGGRTETGVVRLSPGEYRMICTVGNHAELGMVGSVQVE